MAWANQDNDYNEVVLTKNKRGPTTLKSEKAVSAAQRQGLSVSTDKKFSAGQNKQKGVDANQAKLDRETEELHHEKLSLSVAKLIQQGRQSKGLSQKELATAICEKPQVVNDYEKGASIPNSQILGKMERVLGVKLQGKNKGQPLAFGPKKKDGN